MANRLADLFAAIDAKDTAAFLGFLADDAEFRFGSAPSATGHDGIRAAVDGFFDTIAGSTHRVVKTITDRSTFMCEGEVTYTRHDRSQVTLPFINVFELDGEYIRQYKIYIDAAPLFAG